MAGTVTAIRVAAGAEVRKGATLIAVEAMKMEMVVAAPTDGVLTSVGVATGDQVGLESVVAVIEACAIAPPPDSPELPGVAVQKVRADLSEVLQRRALLDDAARPGIVADRHAAGRRTARENLADLCDAGSFVEYGGFAVAAQRNRRALEDLIARTPADGLVSGVGQVNGGSVSPDRAGTAVLSYDYTVLAGTQGLFGHRKKDRLFEVIERMRLPAVFFTEGGGGRPSDTDQVAVGLLDTPAFSLWAGLSGVVPRIGIASGPCFAGNAALFGCCDITIATPGASIGMGGPAMIEGGGLGVVATEDVGPLEMHLASGVVDIAAADDVAAVAIAKQAVSYFQGILRGGEAADQTRLRDVVPELRTQAYDVHEILMILCDTGSVLELRDKNAPGMVTALARVDGRPVGIVANNPLHEGGAVTSAGADKAARFLQLCEAFRLPVISLCDTPGIMVGSEAEKTGTVRHASRLFVVGAALTVPLVTVVLRKAYGLGAMAMSGGHTRRPLLTVAWPTGEFGAMGLEGAVKLALRKELAAAPDDAGRQQLLDGAVAFAFEHGKALNTASYLEIDDVIDPATTRDRILAILTSAPQEFWRDLPVGRFVDTW
jgi:acetyl-CoA carboxylase carboxyltransferase component